MGYMCLFQFWFPQGICLGVGLLDHMVVLFLVFKESPYHLPWCLYQSTFPPTVQEHSLFSTPSPAFIVCRLFGDGHSDWCGVISHCSFDLHFSNNEWCWASFHVLLAIHMSSLEKCLFRSFAHFWLGCLLFWHSVVWGTCIFWKLILCQLFHLILFSPILRVVFSPYILYIYNILHCCVKAFKYNQVPLVYFCLYFHYSRR